MNNALGITRLLGLLGSPVNGSSRRILTDPTVNLTALGELDQMAGSSPDLFYKSNSTK